MNNLSSYCGLVYAKMRASDKDLPVILNSERTDETSVCVQRYNLFFINMCIHGIFIEGIKAQQNKETCKNLKSCLDIKISPNE